MQGPRIHPLPPAERDERTQELVSSMSIGEGELNIFTTLARHPRLLKQWSRFGGTLLARGEIPPRERELLILRTAWNTQADYEWGQHVRIGKDTGLTDEEIGRIPAGPDADGWDAFDAVLVQAADELHNDARLGDATWAALAERYDARQLIELCMLVGQYHLVAFTLNSLGVEREPGVEGLPT
jgi:alkylhydroperoxidase family enzyme